MADLRFKGRNSNVEILRIIAMVFILLSHFTCHGAIDVEAMDFSFNKALLNVIYLGNLGVNIYVLITGYYVSQKKYSAFGLFKIIFHTLSYTLIFLALFSVFDRDSVTPIYLIKSLFPVLSGSYWFISAYVILYVLSPFLNLFISNVKRSTYLRLLISLVVIWYILPNFIDGNLYVNKVITLIFMYLIGGYLRKYPNNFFSKPKIAPICTGIIVTLLVALTLILDFLSNKGHSLYYFNSPLLLVLSICIFASLTYRKAFCNGFINAVAGCTFGVYLIHENIFVKSVLWTKWLNDSAFENSPLLILVAIGSVVAIYVLCTLIEFVYQRAIFKPFTKWIYNHKDKLDLRINKTKADFLNKFDIN